jgi:hypothetical protein
MSVVADFFFLVSNFAQMIDMVQKPLLLIEASKQKSQYTATGEPRLKEKKASLSTGGQGSSSQGGFVIPPAHLQHALLPSPTLQPPLFHSHHKPFHSTATHTPVQGGAVYNVAEGLFYKKDLRESKMAAQFFATLFNLNKFVLSEQRDPIRIKQIHDTPQLSDWDRYAISGYCQWQTESSRCDVNALPSSVADFSGSLFFLFQIVSPSFPRPRMPPLRGRICPTAVRRIRPGTITTITWRRPTMERSRKLVMQDRHSSTTTLYRGRGDHHRDRTHHTQLTISIPAPAFTPSLIAAAAAAIPPDIARAEGSRGTGVAYPPEAEELTSSRP